jgi:hypothetical protein
LDEAIARLTDNDATLREVRLEDVHGDAAKRLMVALQSTKCPNLRALGLRSSSYSAPKLGHENLQALASAILANDLLQRLTTLDLCFQRMGPEGAKALAPALEVRLIAFGLFDSHAELGCERTMKSGFEIHCRKPSCMLPHLYVMCSAVRVQCKRGKGLHLLCACMIYT